MSKIYIASKPVVIGFEHLYLVYDPDSDPTNGNEEIIRGGPSQDAPPWGYIAMEAPYTIIISEDTLDSGADGDPLIYTADIDPYSDRNYTTLDLGGRSADEVWSVMTAQAQSLADVEINYDIGAITPAYQQNSNSVVATILSAVGIDISAGNTPKEGGDTGTGGVIDQSTFPGYAVYMSGTGSDTLYGWGGNDKFIDIGGGSDVFYGGDAATKTFSLSDGLDWFVYENQFSVHLDSVKVKQDTNGNAWLEINDPNEAGAVDTLYSIEQVYGRDYSTSNKGDFYNLNASLHLKDLDGTELSALQAVVGDFVTTAVSAEIGANVPLTFGNFGSFIGTAYADSFELRNVLGRSFDGLDNQDAISYGNVSGSQGLFIDIPSGTAQKIGDSSVTDTFTNFESVVATDNDDTILSSFDVGSFYISAAAGDDTVQVTSSNGTGGQMTHFVGGAGYDVIDFSSLSDDLTVRNYFDIEGFEEVRLGSGDDVIEADDFFTAAFDKHNYYYDAGAGYDTVRLSASTHGVSSNGSFSWDYDGNYGSNAYISPDGKLYVNGSALVENADVVTDLSYLLVGSLSLDHSAGKVDYSLLENGITFDYKTFTVSDGTSSVSILNNPYHIVGTNQGDVFLTQDIRNPNNATIYLGGGNDIVRDADNLNSYSEYGVIVNYSSGQDTVYTGLLNRVELDHGISLGDVSAPIENNVQYTHETSTRYYYTADVTLDILGRGSITFKDVVKSVYKYDPENIDYENAPQIYLMEEDGTLYGFTGYVAGNGAPSEPELPVDVYGDDNVSFASETVAVNIDSGLGNDVITGTGYNDVLLGNLGNDDIHGGAGSDSINGGIGDDTLRGDAGNDTLYGGWGNDTFYGDAGNDVVNGGTGYDTLVYANTFASYTLDIVNNNTIQFTHNGGGDGTDKATDIERVNFSDFEFEFFDGHIKALTNAPTEAGDVIAGTEYGDYLEGLGGDDTLSGGNGDDLLNGGEGDDTLDGGDGIDEAVFSGSFSYYTISGDTVTDNVGNDGTDTVTSIERLVFSDGVYEDGVFTSSTDDNIFLATSAADSFDGGDGIDTVNYALSDQAVSIDLKNGTASGGYAEGDVLTSIENLVGSAYDDYLLGDNNDNDIRGGAGADEIRGYDGADTLSGDGGDDTIYGYDGDDVINGGDGIDKIRGGTGNDVIYTGDGDDTDVRGEEGDDTIYGEGGADKLRGSEGNDTIYGGDGDDFLLGDFDEFDTITGNDILDGGAGNDTLNGGLGDDTYIASDGSDYINDRGGVDTIAFGAGISIQDLTVTFDAGDTNDAIITFGANQIAIENQFDTAGDLVIEKVSFADGASATLARVADWIYAPVSGGVSNGTSLSNTIIGGAGNDTLNGLAGDDELFGGAGDDVLRGDAGNDQLHGGDGTNTAIFSGLFSNYIISGNTIEDTVGADGTDTFFNIQRFKFFDGVYESGVFTPSADDDVLPATAAPDILDGGAGSDTADYSASTYAVNVDLLTGTASGGYAKGDVLISIENLIGSDYDDILAGDAGNNALSGGLGDDTYIYRGGLDAVSDTGGADTLVLENVTAAQVSLVYDGNDLVVTVDAGVNEVRLLDHALAASSIETVRFSDGFYADLTDPAGWIISNDILTVEGSADDDVFIFGNADNEGKGFGGNDYLYGGAGNDTLRGYEGSDVLFGADGADKLLGGDDNDILDAGDGDDIDVRGEGGDDVVFGGAGNDTLYGDYNATDTLAGNDTLDGGLGNDDLRGGLGNDTYIASAGDDYIKDRGGDDVLRFGDGITIFDLSSAADPGDTNDRIITFGANTIHIENQTDSAGDYTIETVLFADGTYANLAGINDWLYATPAGGTIHGSYTRDDTIIGGDGDDAFYGKDGNDQLFGGAGNDDLKGNNGDDLLVAGAGADRLEGHAGADTFFFSGPEIVDGNLNRVVDFTISDNDVLILENVLQGYDPLTDAISDFITMDTTSHTYLSIDIDGKGESYGMVEDVIRLENITAWTDVQDMITQGDLVVV